MNLFDVFKPGFVGGEVTPEQLEDIMLDRPTAVQEDQVVARTSPTDEWHFSGRGEFLLVRPAGSTGYCHQLPPAEELPSWWEELTNTLNGWLGPRRRALWREVTPRNFDGERLVVGVASWMPFHLSQLRSDSALLYLAEYIASELAGHRVRIELELDLEDS